VVASAVMRAMFPKDAARRAFLKSVGASTALAALSQFFPIKTATEVFAEGGAPEKKDLKVGFIPITCATPIIMAAPLGFYAKHGLNVEVVKTAGWAVIRDKTLNKEYDAAHMLAPMPLAISLGLGANAIPFTVPAIENINGQGITLAMKHKDKRNPADWKGMKFAIPFDYSMHNYLLRYYLAEHGLDPDTDVQLRSVPPPEMVANLRAENIDGFLAPDNICQRAIYDGVGFMHLLSKEIWDGHPCCSFAASREFITTSPNSFAALTRAIVDATAYASKTENRKEIAEAIAPANYLNAPVTVLEQVLTGTYADGLGGVKTDPKRVDFDPTETLGPDQGRCRLQAGRRTGLSRHRHPKGDGGDGIEPAADVLQVVFGDGQDLRSSGARGLSQQLQDQEGIVTLTARHILIRGDDSSRSTSP
jgi:nitrate/nitrite transport system substrate-binding protein